MRKYLKKIPQELKDLINKARDISDKKNLKVYLVGGFVRDLILGIENLDLDIVVEGDGINFAEALAAASKGKLTRHRRFGTATVMLHRGLKIDIATARKESYPFPGSLPEVTPGSLKDDLLRRDFTINAMAMGITGRAFGKVIDIFDGQRDLKEGKVGVLHDLSFLDDPTRILRAIRFEQRLNFKIEKHTLELLKEASRKKMLNRVEPQRLRDELILVLKEKEPLRQLKRIKSLTGFSFISPRLSLGGKQYSVLRSVNRQIAWFKNKHYARRRLDDWIIYLMGLTDTLDPKRLKSVCEIFAFTGGEQKRMLGYKKLSRMISRKLARPGIKPSEVFSLLEPLSYETIIMIKSKYRTPAVQRHIEDFFAVYNGMRPHVRGDDLRRLGVLPGPHYKKIFSRVLQEKLNGRLSTKEEELSLIAKLAAKGIHRGRFTP
ncbi:MAG: hypothetical protein WC723_05785 [Candidatus Omnitrophota bacterium]